MYIKKILIIGLGYLGTQIAEIIQNKQYLELYSNLSPNIIAGINRNFYHYKFNIIQTPQDITKEFLLQANWDYIIFCVSPNHYSEQAYKDIYLTGLNNILSKLDANNLCNPKFLLVSSTAVYNYNKAELVTEKSATNPSDFNGKILLQAEKLLLDSSLQTKIILRLGGIYGDSRLMLLNKIKNSTPVLLKYKKYTNRIHVLDAARLILFLLNKQHDDYIFNGVDSNPLENNSLCQIIAKLFNYDLNLEFNTDSTRQVKNNKKVSNQKVLNLGFSFIYTNYIEYCKTVYNKIRH